MFPGNAKMVCVPRLDKHTDDKYSVTNFRPASVLNTFFKTHEKIVKDFFISRRNINFLNFFPHTANPLELNMSLLHF